MDRSRLGKIFIFALFAALTAAIAFYLYYQRPAGLPAGFASGNGRLEAIEVDVATKFAGRLSELGPREGDMVEAGAVVARLPQARALELLVQDRTQAPLAEVTKVMVEEAEPQRRPRRQCPDSRQ